MLQVSDLSEWGVGAMAANPDEKIPMMTGETARLAIVDLDWERIRAVDILACLRSFLAKVCDSLSLMHTVQQAISRDLACCSNAFPMPLSMHILWGKVNYSFNE